MRNGLPAVCPLAILLLTGFGVEVGGGQQPQPPQVGADQVRQLLIQARPALEQVLNASWQRFPTASLVTAQKASQGTDVVEQAQVRHLFPHLDAKAGKQAQEVVQHLAAGLTLARMVPGKDELLVVPENLAAVAGRHEGLQAVQFPAYLQIALAHELIRDVLDRRYRLTQRLTATRDSEEFQVLLALWEGKALALTRQVAEKLGREQVFSCWARRYLGVPDVAPEPGLRAVCQRVLRQRHEAGVQGMEFFEALAAKTPPVPEASVFNQPPRQSAWLQRPELYVKARQAKTPGLTAVVAAVEKTGPAIGWSAYQQPWTPAMVRQAAALFGEGDQADKALKTWEEARSLVWVTKANPGQVAAVSLVRHESAAGAKAYFHFADHLYRKRDKLTPAAPGKTPEVVDSKASAANFAGLDEAVRYDKRLQVGQATHTTGVILARRGELVIEVGWQGFTPETAWFERVLEAVGK